jgi:hypothetical protein
VTIAELEAQRIVSDLRPAEHAHAGKFSGTGSAILIAEHITLAALGDAARNFSGSKYDSTPSLQTMATSWPMSWTL